MTAFTQTITSTSGAPDIEFKFDGDTCKAELDGAKLYVERRIARAGYGFEFDMLLKASDGEVLACIVVVERPHRDDSENVTDIGSALMWSHWRWLQSKGPNELKGASK